jgi:cation transport regulator ChaC
MSLEETVRHLATGVGIFGSSLAYIESLAQYLEAIGIDDGALFRLCNISQQMATALRVS